MTVPKPVLVIIAIVIVVVVGCFAVMIFRMTPTNTQGKPEASANQLVSVQSVREFQQAHPDAFVMEVFGDGNFAPVIDQADNDVRIWCLDSRGEATMTVAEFAARSCQPEAVIGVYGGRFAGVNFGTKRGPGKLHAIIHQWGTNKFQSLAGMFMAFYSVKLPDLDSRQSGQRKTAESMTPPVMSAVPDLSETTTMANAFNSVVEIYGDISGWDVRRIQNFAHVFESSGFQGDLSTWQPASATDMSNMFWGCASLTSLDLSSFDTSRVQYMGGMFSGCSSLASLDLSGWDTSEVTGMSGMFSGCASLSSLDLSGFDTSGAGGMWGMFLGCSSLSSLAVGEGCGGVLSADMHTALPAGVSGWGWHSERDKRWLTLSELSSSRQGVADTYTAPGAWRSLVSPQAAQASP